MKEFKVNDYITLKLENKLASQQGLIGSIIGWVENVFIPREHYATIIYINGKRFNQCKYILLDIPLDNVEAYDSIQSIDEASESLDRSLEIFDGHLMNISPDTEFWAHCSNLQAWADNEYDTRLLHSNLAFPMLKELTEAGDPVAKRVYKEEIASRFTSGHVPVIKYLIREKYIASFTREESEVLKEQLTRKNIECVMYGDRICGVIDSNMLDLSHSQIRDMDLIEGIENVTDLRTFDLSHNYIKEISGLENLRNLERLDLSFNQIYEIKGLENLLSLRKLNLWFNPIKLGQLYLLIQTPQDIVKYCQRNRTSSQ